MEKISFKKRKNKLQKREETKRSEIVSVDAVRSWRSCVYQEFKDIFEENKQGFEGKSPTLTHFIAFEEYMAVAKSLYGVVQYFHDGRDSPTVNIFHRG